MNISREQNPGNAPISPSAETARKPEHLPEHLINAFDFALPETSIALRPARPRQNARLLVFRGRSGLITHHRIADLPDVLNRGDILVVNDSKVVRAALTAHRPGRQHNGPPVRIEMLLHRRIGPALWRAFARPGKRLRIGDRLQAGPGFDMIVTEKTPQDIVVTIDGHGQDPDRLIAAHGDIPLPPYIRNRRPTDAYDNADYQTCFASAPGSAAAPTAGLHFTPDLVASLTSRGVAIETVTLHTGAATFAPVRATTIDAHAPGPEICAISSQVAGRITSRRTAGGRCIAVGTTCLRTLHTAWDNGVLRAFEGQTDIFVRPGFSFAAIDGLMTNFHLPRSSLFILVCALMGRERMLRVYGEAARAGYRFYSYGDSCLLLPDD